MAKIIAHCLSKLNLILCYITYIHTATERYVAMFVRKSRPSKLGESGAYHLSGAYYVYLEHAITVSVVRIFRYENRKLY